MLDNHVLEGGQLFVMLSYSESIRIMAGSPRTVVSGGEQA